MAQLVSKEESLLDAYLDKIISKEDYEKRKVKLLMSIKQKEEILERLKNDKSAFLNQIEELLELCKSPIELYDSAIKDEKREILKILTSNLVLRGGKLMFTIQSPFRELANRSKFSLCALERDEDRTLYTKYIYSDINTSAIVPEPLNKEEIKGFFEYLLQNPDTLQDLNLTDLYEI